MTTGQDSMHRIVHIEIPSENQQGACDFYGSLFGWPTETYPEMEYAGYNPGDERAGVGFAKLDEHYQRGRVIVHVSTPDINASLAKVNELGGKTLVEKTPIPGMGSYAIFEDPNGNPMALYQDGAEE